MIEDKLLGQCMMRINETMRDRGVETNDRIVVFTAFLVACRDDDFRRTLADVKSKKSANQLGRLVHSAISNQIEEVASFDDQVANNLKGFAAYVKPKLVGDNQQPTNGAQAIERIAYRDLRELCAHAGIGIEEWVERMNASLFNLVDVYEVFKAYSPTNDLGQYFTPRQTVRAMIHIAEAMRKRPCMNTTSSPRSGVRRGWVSGGRARTRGPFEGEQGRAGGRQEALRISPDRL